MNFKEYKQKLFEERPEVREDYAQLIEEENNELLQKNGLTMMSEYDPKYMWTRFCITKPSDPNFVFWFMIDDTSETRNKDVFNGLVQDYIYAALAELKKREEKNELIRKYLE